jgi:pantetheine-phosphate adenylyltransferase
MKTGNRKEMKEPQFTEIAATVRGHAGAFSEEESLGQAGFAGWKPGFKALADGVAKGGEEGWGTFPREGRPDRVFQANPSPSPFQSPTDGDADSGFWTFLGRGEENGLLGGKLAAFLLISHADVRQPSPTSRIFSAIPGIHFALQGKGARGIQGGVPGLRDAQGPQQEGCHQGKEEMGAKDSCHGQHNHRGKGGCFPVLRNPGPCGGGNEESCAGEDRGRNAHAFPTLPLTEGYLSSPSYNSPMAESPPVLFPGSFDPPTLGHLDLIQRGVDLFGKVWVGVAANPGKAALFSSEERVAMIETMTDGLEVEVSVIQGLVVEAARERGVSVLLRGVRGSTDLDLEYPMAMTNRELNAAMETVCLLARPEFSTISSRLLREVYEAGGELPRLLAPSVHTALREKFPPS